MFYGHKFVFTPQYRVLFRVQQHTPLVLNIILSGDIQKCTPTKDIKRRVQELLLIILRRVNYQWQPRTTTAVPAVQPFEEYRLDDNASSSSPSDDTAASSPFLPLSGAVHVNCNLWVTPYQLLIVKVEIKKSSSVYPRRTRTWLRSCCCCHSRCCRTAWTGSACFILAKHVKFEFRLGLEGCRFLHEKKNCNSNLWWLKCENKSKKLN